MKLKTVIHRRFLNKLIVLILFYNITCPFSSLAQTPFVSFTTVSDTFNYGDTIVFTNTSTGFISTTLFTWEFDDYYCDTLPYLKCTESVFGSDSVVHIYRMGGNFHVRLRANDQYSNIIDSVREINVTYPSSNRIIPSQSTCMNMVPNGDFEVFDLLRYPNHNVEYLHTNCIDDWHSDYASGSITGQSSSDYYRTEDIYKVCGENLPSCNWEGYSIPKSGNAFVGIATFQHIDGQPDNYRESIIGDIVPLVTGQDYILMFWARMSENSSNSTELHAALTATPCTSFVATRPGNEANVLQLNPNVTSRGLVESYNWVPIFGRIHADGSERFLTIGNFGEDDASQIKGGPFQVLQSLDLCDNTGSGCYELDYRHDHRDESSTLKAYYFIDLVTLLPVSGSIDICATSTSDCSGTNWTLSIENPGSSGYIWSTGETTTTINVTIPAGGQTDINVVGNSPDGCRLFGTIHLESGNFVTHCQASSLTICEGESIDLTAYGAENYSWTINGSPVGTSTSTITVSPTTTTTYTVRGICTGPDPDLVDEDFITVTVLDITKSIDILSSSTVFCPGADPIRLLATGGATNYNWTPSTGLDVTVGQAVLVNPSALGTSNITYNVTAYDNTCMIEASITLSYSADCGENAQQCLDCLPSFSPDPGKWYIFSCWVSEPNDGTLLTYNNPKVTIDFNNSSSDPVFLPKGEIIDGWQRIESEFLVPSGSTLMTVQLQNAGSSAVYFDDIRIFPREGEMKTFVYDPEHLRFVCELDENNYGTFYEYDEEGHLTRIKKETERGVMTIQEGRTSSVKR